tara:strand:- start:3336 stop:3884 length:549 start_codon:yes stop_codon:yes gene_type:complete
MNMRGIGAISLILAGGCCLIGQFTGPIAEATPVDVATSELDELRAEVAALTARIEAMQSSACQCLEAAATPEEPEGEPEEPVRKIAPEESEIQRVLQTYTGAAWQYKNGRGQQSAELLRSHLVDEHGLNEDELSGLAWQDLRRLHGHAHTSGKSATKQSTPSKFSRSVLNCPGGKCRVRRRR